MSVVAFGELLIDFVALENGVTVGEASGFLKAPGGAPANVAVAVERLGQRAAFLGQVGNDPFGYFLGDVLIAEGVETKGLRYTDRARTPLAFVSLAADGERSFMFYRNPSADMLMTPDDVAYDVIEAGRIFHYGSITLIDDPVRSATLAAVEHARKSGLMISYDPNLRLALWPNEKAAKEGMRLGLEHAHIVKISEEELEFLTGNGSAYTLWKDQMQAIIVTHGAKGATLYTQGGKTHCPGFSVQSVDTTGAGDSFVAGFLVGVLEQGGLDNPMSLLRFANATGALTTQAKGAIPALPLRSKVDDFLLDHPQEAAR
jgi:fructokinase